MEQNIDKDNFENYDNHFLSNLNQVLLPDLKSFSNWSDFKIKILQKEYVIDFLYNSNNLKTFAPTFFKSNNILLNIKYPLLIGLLIAIIFTKSYYSLFLILISTIGSSFMQGRKDRRKLMLSLTLLSIIIFQYFFMVNWAFIIIIFLSCFLNFLIYQIYDNGLTAFILKHEDNIILLLEKKVILKLIDKKIRNNMFILQEKEKNDLTIPINNWQIQFFSNSFCRYR